MRIAILGSTGFVGKVLVKKAIEAGYQVKTLARNPEKLEEIKDKIEIITGSNSSELLYRLHYLQSSDAFN